MKIKIEVAKERKTGFPCVRLDGDQEFISLLPVTKLQAEEWIWKTGDAPDDAMEFNSLLDRLEVRNTGNQFPKAVQSLIRQPIPQQSSDTILSLIATNLSVWNTDEETHSPDALFPTPASEWGRLVGWLGGRIPYYREWAITVDSLLSVPTMNLIEGVLRTRMEWDRVVEDMLLKVKESLPRDATGLPFMKAGLYELISDHEKFKRLALSQRRECRPQVMGDSSIWPTLNSTEMKSMQLSHYRPLRQRTLPVVAVRLWYADAEVSGRLSHGEYESFEVEEVIVEERPAESTVAAPAVAAPVTAASASDRWFSRIRSKQPASVSKEEKLSAYIPPPGEKMKHKCPFCHEKIDEGTFMTKANFSCYEELVEVTKADGSKKPEPKRRHSIEISAGRGLQKVAKEYLRVAQSQPDRVHTVLLIGGPGAGKTAWLLSLGGLMDYPDGNPLIFQTFPKHWQFLHFPLSLDDFTKNQTPTDRIWWTEQMWLDGKLPPRNSPGEEAFRCPILFNCSPRGREQQLLTLLDDIAGEALFEDLANNKNFPHVASTADAVFFLPADNISAVPMTTFIKQIGLARDNGVAIDLKKINLLIVISKVDQLKHGDRRERELFDCVLPRSYRFPRFKTETEKAPNIRWQTADLQAYFAEMKEVHWLIEKWMQEHMPLLVRQSNRFFGSVRYCGLSAFGFQPKKEPGESEEYSLPFRPEPVRVVDPIFWLLKENNLIEF